MNNVMPHRWAQLSRLILVAGAMVLVFYGLMAYPSLWNLVFLSVVLSIALAPAVKWLTKKGLSYSVATILMTLALVILLLALGLFVIYSAEVLIKGLPDAQAKMQAQIANIDAWLTAHNITSSEITSAMTKVVSAIFSELAKGLSEIAPMLFVLVFTPLITLFMLLEAPGFGMRLQKRLASNPLALDSLNRFAFHTRKYIWVTTLLGVLKGGTMTVALALLGIDYALIWGVLYFIMNYVPYIGIIIALIPPVLMAWGQYGPAYALLVFIIYEIVDNTISYIIMPRVMGEEVDVSMTVGIVTFFLFAWLLGPIGGILSYPYTLAVKDVVLGSSEDTRWLANLMNMGMPKPEELAADAPKSGGDS